MMSDKKVSELLARVIEAENELRALDRELTSVFNTKFGCSDFAHRSTKLYHIGFERKAVTLKISCKECLTYAAGILAPHLISIFEDGAGKEVFQINVDLHYLGIQAASAKRGDNLNNFVTLDGAINLFNEKIENMKESIRNAHKRRMENLGEQGSEGCDE